MPLLEPKKPKTLREKLAEEQAAAPYAGSTPPPVAPAAAPKAAKPAADPAAKVENFLVKTVESPGGIASAPDTTPDPKSFAQVLAQLRREPTGLSAADKKAFQSRVDELNSRLIAEEKRYEDSKERHQWGEVAEIIGQATIQLLAGAQASKYGQSSAGIATPKINWDSRFDRLLKEYDSRKDTVEKQRAGLERELERTDAKLERKGERVQNWVMQDYMNTQNSLEQAARAAAKESADKGADQAKLQREADAKAKAIISNYELAGDAVRRLENKEYANDKERRELESEVTKQLSAAGNIEAVKALQEGVDESGFWLFKSKDYSKLKNYIDLNKKSGIINHYKGYGLPVPPELRGAATQPSGNAGQFPREVSNGSQVATVQNEQELKEAMAAGFK
jgi:hypothetical protein